MRVYAKNAVLSIWERAARLIFSLRSAAAEGGFDGAMAQLAQAAELLVEVLLQAAVEPADEQAEGLTGVAHDERLPVLGADSARVELPFQKGLHHVAAQLHQMLLVHVAAGGIEDVQVRAAVFQNELHGDFQTVLEGLDGWVLADDQLGLLVDDGLDEIGHVAEVIIEGVAVDAALLDDVLDGDFIQRALVQQPDEGFDNGLSGKG